jgi:hypothetical protein
VTFLYNGAGSPQTDLVSQTNATAIGDGLVNDETAFKFGSSSVRGNSTLSPAWGASDTGQRDYIKWTGVPDLRGSDTQDWWLEGWFMIPSSLTLPEGAAPIGLFGNDEPVGGWGGIAGQSWNMQYVPNLAGTFQYGFYFTEANGDVGKVGSTSLPAESFERDVWHHVAAQRTYLTFTSTAVSTWLDGSLIATAGINPDLDFFSGQFLVGIPNVTGWGGQAARFHSGNVDMVAYGTGTRWTYNADITVPTTRPCI